MQILDSSLLISQSYFNNGGTQLYLILKPLYYALKRPGGPENVVSWKYKGLPAKNLLLLPLLLIVFLHQLNGTSFTPPNIIIFFIVYELGTWSRDLNSDFTLKDCLFGDVKLTKNANPDKYVYTGYGIGFNSRSGLSLPDGSSILT